jgi:hypothetical protein
MYPRLDSYPQQGIFVNTKPEHLYALVRISYTSVLWKENPFKVNQSKGYSGGALVFSNIKVNSLDTSTSTLGYPILEVSFFEVLEAVSTEDVEDN